MLSEALNAVTQQCLCAKQMILFWYRITKSATAACCNDDNCDFFGHKRDAVTCLNCAAGYLSAMTLPSRHLPDVMM
jgi:hypothetical protein